MGSPRHEDGDDLAAAEAAGSDVDLAPTARNDDKRNAIAGQRWIRTAADHDMLKALSRCPIPWGVTRGMRVGRMRPESKGASLEFVRMCPHPDRIWTNPDATGTTCRARDEL